MCDRLRKAEVRLVLVVDGADVEVEVDEVEVGTGVEARERISAEGETMMTRWLIEAAPSRNA